MEMKDIKDMCRNCKNVSLIQLDCNLVKIKCVKNLCHLIPIDTECDLFVCKN